MRKATGPARHGVSNFRFAIPRANILHRDFIFAVTQPEEHWTLSSFHPRSTSRGQPLFQAVSDSVCPSDPDGERFQRPLALKLEPRTPARPGSVPSSTAGRVSFCHVLQCFPQRKDLLFSFRRLNIIAVPSAPLPGKRPKIEHETDDIPDTLRAPGTTLAASSGQVEHARIRLACRMPFQRAGWDAIVESRTFTASSAKPP